MDKKNDIENEGVHDGGEMKHGVEGESQIQDENEGSAPGENVEEMEIEEQQDPSAQQKTESNDNEGTAPEENVEEMEIEEQEDPFAQQKRESNATIEKITNSIVGIEETVARHKTKAGCLKLGIDIPSAFDEQLYRAAKINRYDTGMSSEFLMKHLIELDNCLSYGCTAIKNKRKALVRRIQQITAQADSLSQQ